MIYNLDSEVEIGNAKRYFDKLISNSSLIEIREVTKRSLSQNNYLHLIIGYFGLEFGYTSEEAKMIYKMLNNDVYFYKKDDIDFVRSTSDIEKDKLTATIEKFRDYSAEMGCYLPEPSDIAFLKSIQIELYKNSKK